MTIYIHKTDPCCSKVILDGDEDVKQIHGDKLGIYEMMNISNTSNVFKRSGSDYYLHRSASMKWLVSLALHIYCSEIPAKVNVKQNDNHLSIKIHIRFHVIRTLEVR